MTDLVCFSVPVMDGWTGERIGWMYGGHIWRDDAALARCPTCGELRHAENTPK